MHSAFVLRHLSCLQKVQLLVYCVDGNDVAVGAVCGSLLHLVETGVHVHWQTVFALT